MFVKTLKNVCNRFINILHEAEDEGRGVFTKNYFKSDHIQIGEYSYGRPQVLNHSNRYRLSIGKFCSIASNVMIMIDGNHRTDFITTYPLDYFVEGVERNPNTYSLKGDVNIGNDVWIGYGVTILPGVNIGDGAVIAAGSVVTKNVGDFEIVGGIPASHIRYRFTGEQIKSLKEIQWWNWSIDKVKENALILQSPDIKKFIETFSDKRNEMV